MLTMLSFSKLFRTTSDRDFSRALADADPRTDHWAGPKIAERHGLILLRRRVLPHDDPQTFRIGNAS